MVVWVRGCWGVGQKSCEAISRTESLSSLDVGFCTGLTSVGLWSMAFGLCHLHFVTLSGCKNFSELSLLSFVANQTELIDLNIAGCHLAVTNAVLSVISEKLINLRSLDLSLCDLISESGVMSLSRLSLLEKLSLRKCPGVCIVALQPLSNLMSLSYLDVSCCNVADKNVKSLLPQVETIIVEED